jgi:hypothetical protein
LVTPSFSLNRTRWRIIGVLLGERLIMGTPTLLHQIAHEGAGGFGRGGDPGEADLYQAGRAYWGSDDRIEDKDDQYVHR